MAAYVTYYRVSTAAQGRSGLGLAAQRTRIEQHLTSEDCVLAEFVEVQSGRKDDRLELWKAVAYAKRNDARILIAKLDRFSRRVSFIARLMDEGVGLVVADLPNATDFQLHIFAALAQEERRMISDRTRAALREAKQRGIVLGRNGAVLADRNRRMANERAEALKAEIGPLLVEGASYRRIATVLNERGHRTVNGGQYFPQTVKNIALRLTNETDKHPINE